MPQPVRYIAQRSWTKKGLGFVAAWTHSSIPYRVACLNCALICDSITVHVALPSIFNELMQKNYSLLSFTNFTIVAGMVLLLLMISGLAGFYPALVMSSMKPVEVLKGKSTNELAWCSTKKNTRDIPVHDIFRACNGYVDRTLDQLDYMQKQSLGFDKDNIIVVNLARAKSSPRRRPSCFKRTDQRARDRRCRYIHQCASRLHWGWPGRSLYPEGRAGKDAVSVEYTWPSMPIMFQRWV